MLNLRIIIFLFLASVFAAVHWLAIEASLYWYYWWFDIPMHFFGGVLIAFGVWALATFRYVFFQDTWMTLLVVLALITGVWEVLERFAGLYNPETYLFDTAKDIVMGFSGGILTRSVLLRKTRGLSK